MSYGIRQKDINVMSYTNIKLISYDRNTYTAIRQEGIQVMSYGRNNCTTIRQEDIKVMS